MNIVNQHAPIRKFRVKGPENPCFSPELSDTVHQHNAAWAKARNTVFASDWSVFRQLRNKCTSLIKQAKSEYYLSVTTENLNNPQKFWKVFCIIVSPAEWAGLPSLEQSHISKLSSC